MNNYTTQYLKKKKKSCITIYIKLKQNLSVFHHLYIFVDINSDDDQLEKQDHSSFEQFFYIIQQTNEPKRDFFFLISFSFLIELFQLFSSLIFVLNLQQMLYINIFSIIIFIMSIGCYTQKKQNVHYIFPHSCVKNDTLYRIQSLLQLSS